MGRNAKRMRAGFGKALSVLLSAVLLLSMSFPSAAVAQVGSESLGAGSSQTEDAGNAESSDAPVASDVQAALPDEGEADASDEAAGAEEAKDEAGDGKVASDVGELGSFAFVKAANAEEDMDIAEAGATAFAVYSADDGSLSFYKRASVPSAGDQFNGKTATAVYAGIETDVYSQPWEGYCDSIRKAEVVDEGISPVSTAFWFRDCSNLTSIEGVGKLDTRAVESMYYMFFNCPKLTSLDLSRWNTGKVTDMECMFWGCSSITSLNLSGWDTGAVEIMADMFSRCSSLASIDGISGWDTGSVKNMYDMFRGCSSLTSLDLSGWDTGSVWNMTSMFRGCSKLASLDLSGWDTGSIRNMRCMFQDCSELTLLDGISGWDTGSVENMYSMFLGCSSLSSLDLSGWDTRVVTVTDSMFSGCSSLASLDLSGWNTRAVEYMDSMFDGCSRLAKLVLGADTSLGRMADSDVVTSCKWIKGAEADQNVVEGTYLLTANEGIAAGATETFQKAVFFDANDGTGAAPTARSLYDLGWTYSSESVADAARDGYGFNGWYTESSGGARLADGDALSATTYYAQWTKSLHSLTVTNQVAGEESGKSQVSRTGDSTAAAWPLAILGAAALAAVLVSARRRRS